MRLNRFQSPEPEPPRLVHEFTRPGPQVCDKVSYLEVDAMPEKPTIIRKLKDMGRECFPASLAVKIHDQDAATMRSSGILVAQLWSS